MQLVFAWAFRYNPSVTNKMNLALCFVFCIVRSDLCSISDFSQIGVVKSAKKYVLLSFCAAKYCIKLYYKWYPLQCAKSNWLAFKPIMMCLSKSCFVFLFIGMSPAVLQSRGIYLPCLPSWSRQELPDDCEQSSTSHSHPAVPRLQQRSMMTVWPCKCSAVHQDWI